jgi:hypothetical protein
MCASERRADGLKSPFLHDREDFYVLGRIKVFAIMENAVPPGPQPPQTGAPQRACTP